MSRSPSVVSLTAALGDFTVRAAFSHIPLAQSTLWMVDNILMKAAPGNVATGTTTDASVPKPQVCLEKPTWKMRLAEQNRAMCNPGNLSAAGRFCL